MTGSYIAARPAVLARVPRVGHVALEASAGTGKTYTLEHLVVDLLLVHRIPIERMLVVTFTEKATEELRERVRAKLRQLASGLAPRPSDPTQGWLIDAEARRRLEDAVVRFDAATLSTIHGFCQRVLTEHSFAHRRLFEQRLVDGRETFARAFGAVVRRELGRQGALRDALLAWLREGNHLDRLQELVGESLRHRAELTPRADSPRLAAAVRELLDAEQGGLLRRALAAAGADDRASACFADLRPMLSAYLQQGTEATTLAEALATWRKRGLTSARGDAKRGKLLDDGLARLAAAGDADAERVSRALATVPETAAPRLAELVGGLRRLVADWLRDHKRSLGLYDFDDMLLHVREAVSGPAADVGLVGSLRARWDVALIDEFQDTDEVQWDIFRSLFFTSGAHRLFLIGDPKQAIYGFRNADVQTYLQARDQIVAAGGALVPLLENFRSTPELLAATNALFAQGFFTGGLESFPAAIAGGPRLVARTGDGVPLSPVVVVRLRTEGSAPRLGMARAAMASWIAGEARALIDEGTRFGIEGQERPLRYADLQVLTRTRAAAKEVAEALRRAGVPHVLYGQEGLLATAEAESVQRLLAALAAPTDASARLKALLTPFFAVALADLAACRELSETDPLTARLLRWAELAEQRRYPSLFRSLLRDSGLVRRLLATREGERELTDYQQIFDLLLEEVHRSPAAPGEVANRLRSWIAGRTAPPGMEPDVQRLEAARDAVQLLTMHRAKGLEAAVVFVVGIGGGGPSGGSQLRLYHRDGTRRVHFGEASGEIATAIAEEERQEAERLYYVALTRARARIYLPEMTGRTTHWRLVEERLRAVGALAGAPGFEVRDVEAAPEQEPPLPTAVSWQPDPALLTLPPRQEGFFALRARHAGRLLTSYTRMRRATDWEQGDGDAEEAAPPAAPGELPGGRDIGVFLHRLLEEVDPAMVGTARDGAAWLEVPAFDALARRLASEHALPASVVGAAKALVWAALRTPIAAAGVVLPEGLWQPHPRSVEMELLFPIPELSHPRLGTGPGDGGGPVFRAGRGFVQGVVDLVFVHEGRTYFVDWKSDRLPAYDRPAVTARVQSAYALQARLYALGVLRLLDLDGSDDYERRFGGFLYCFLRGMGPPGAGVCFSRPSWDELRGWDDELRERTDWGAA